MGMPEQPQSGMNIAPDGTVYEILEDGTIKRIGKVSPDGSFEPFGNWKCPSCGTENEMKNNFCCHCDAKKSVAKPEIKTVQQPKYEEEKQESTKKKFKPMQFIGILIAILYLLYLYIVKPMYDDYTRKSRTAEVPATLSEIVKFQILSREDPNVREYAAHIKKLGFKTNRGTFAMSPGHCDVKALSPKTPYPDSAGIYRADAEYACGENYAYAVGAPKVIECNDKGVGNFVWAVAIDRDKVPEDWWCSCMDLNFNINHGRCY